MVNARFLYKQISKKNITVHEFREQIIIGLLNAAEKYISKIFQNPAPTIEEVNG